VILRHVIGWRCRVLIDVDTLIAHGVRPDHVLHIGAHMCEEAPEYARVGWRVTWVESQQHVVDYMFDRGYDVLHGTIWDTRTTVTFYETNNGQSSSCLPLNLHTHYYPDITVSRFYNVDTITVDDLNVNVDMLNIDIQGAELRALMGAEKTLQNVQWIYTEISTEPLYDGQVLEPELTEWLSDHGFQQTLKTMTPSAWGDALYSRMDTHGDQ